MCVGGGGGYSSPSFNRHNYILGMLNGVIGTYLSHIEWMMYLQWSVQVITPHKCTVLY